jgi:hypothetical protein
MHNAVTPSAATIRKVIFMTLTPLAPVPDIRAGHFREAEEFNTAARGLLRRASSFTNL